MKKLFFLTLMLFALNINAKTTNVEKSAITTVLVKDVALLSTFKTETIHFPVDGQKLKCVILAVSLKAKLDLNPFMGDSDADFIVQATYDECMK